MSRTVIGEHKTARELAQRKKRNLVQGSRPEAKALARKGIHTDTLRLHPRPNYTQKTR